MKKDIEWLKNEMRIRGRFPAENEYVVEQYRQIMELIDQLDEPEVLSQEWIDDHKVARIDNLRKMTTSDVVTVENLKNLLAPKQDKPVIPEWLHKIFSCERDAIQRKYVDPWIVEEVAKTKSYVDNDLKPKPVLFKDEKQCEYVADNYEMIINAIFNGYEAEEEKNWIVLCGDLYTYDYNLHHEDIRLTRQKDRSYIFKDKEIATRVAVLCSGRVEEVTPCN